MTPREIQVLRIVEKHDKINKRRLARLMDITTEYSYHLLNYLAERNYLKKIGRETYHIMPKAIDALISQFQHQQSKLEIRVSYFSSEIKRIEEEINRLIDRKKDLE